MPRPSVVLNIFASIDGRIATAPGRNVEEWTAHGLDGQANYWTHKLYDDLECDALLSGSETCIVWGSHQIRHDQPGYWPQKIKGFIVVDGRGRMEWSQTDTLVVITREDVDPAYLELLGRKGVTYIQAGRGEHVDLKQALQHLYDLGFRRIGLSGGGAINGAFLRAGLIDEISLVFAPLAIGGQSTPTVFDCPDLADLSGVTKLSLIKGEPIGEGCFRLHYRVEQ